MVSVIYLTFQRNSSSSCTSSSESWNLPSSIKEYTKLIVIVTIVNVIIIVFIIVLGWFVLLSLCWNEPHHHASPTNPRAGTCHALYIYVAVIVVISITLDMVAQLE